MVVFTELITRRTSEESWCIFKALFCETPEFCTDSDGSENVRFFL